MIPVTPEPEELPRYLRNEPEHCCLCGRATRTWHTPKDVPVCGGCAERYEPEDLPTKAQWRGSPQAKGVICDPDLVVRGEKG